MANVQSIISLLGQIAPQNLACDWDNVGLQVGDFNQNIKKVLVTLDINDDILEEAISTGAGLIISHHPMIFNGLKSIHNQTETGKLLFKAIKNDIVIYSSHTNLDIAPGGLNDYLAELLKIRDVQPLDVTEIKSLFKLVVFVPGDHLEEVKEAIFANGAGYIGNYSHTSFITDGIGTFKPLAGSNPYSGEKGKISTVSEVRLETIVPETELKRVIRAMFKKHPYEEVAYDIYPLENEGEKSGLGRIGRLQEKIKLADYLKIIRDSLNLKNLQYVGHKKNSIKKVAICSGSGADLIQGAKRSGADLFITGDVKYHQAQLAEELDLALVNAGHYQTEVIVKDLLIGYLEDKINSNDLDIDIIKSQVNTNPWQWF